MFRYGGHEQTPGEQVGSVQLDCELPDGDAADEVWAPAFVRFALGHAG
ncbi:hypothetical protein AKJ09_09377 [Labilithrix luteola]|uniref:Uncharacterized protein n=1 Tax=Labilithrix luteola TaxID=1391654 RepID=A0A0K1QAF5_9BACT|nr:hypothetical protein AKJ09_09377 [Labilithrix luteola]